MSYKEIEVHAGGVIEGLLTPRPLREANRLQGGLGQVSAAPADRGRRTQLDDDAQARTGFWQVNLGGRTVGWAVALLVTVIAAVWVNGNLIPLAPPPAEVALKSSPAIKQPASAPPAESPAPQDPARVVNGAGVVSGADSAAPVQASTPRLAEVDPDKVVTVQGVNPRKPASLFSVTSKEPSALLRTKRQDPSGGTRIEVPEGRTKTIPIGRDDIFRVVEGRDLTIFYQGRMVPPRILESGVWMSFVPQTPGAAND